MRIMHSTHGRDTDYIVETEHSQFTLVVSIPENNFKVLLLDLNNQRHTFVHQTVVNRVMGKEAAIPNALHFILLLSQLLEVSALVSCTQTTEQKGALLIHSEIATESHICLSLCQSLESKCRKTQNTCDRKKRYSQCSCMHSFTQHICIQHTFEKSESFWPASLNTFFPL